MCWKMWSKYWSLAVDWVFFFCLSVQIRLQTQMLRTLGQGPRTMSMCGYSNATDERAWQLFRASKRSSITTKSSRILKRYYCSHWDNGLTVHPSSWFGLPQRCLNMCCNIWCVYVIGLGYSYFCSCDALRVLKDVVLSLYAGILLQWDCCPRPWAGSGMSQFLYSLCQVYLPGKHRSILVLELLDNFDAVKEIFYCAWLVHNGRNIGCHDGVMLCMILWEMIWR